MLIGPRTTASMATTRNRRWNVHGKFMRKILACRLRNWKQAHGDVSRSWEAIHHDQAYRYAEPTIRVYRESRALGNWLGIVSGSR
jgi:hypothetical protein